MVIILDNVINNIDSVKVEIQDILKDQNINLLGFVPNEKLIFCRAGNFSATAWPEIPRI